MFCFNMHIDIKFFFDWLHLSASQKCFRMQVKFVLFSPCIILFGLNRPVFLRLPRSILAIILIMKLTWQIWNIISGLHGLAFLRFPMSLLAILLLTLGSLLWLYIFLYSHWLLSMIHICNTLYITSWAKLLILNCPLNYIYCYSYLALLYSLPFSIVV